MHTVKPPQQQARTQPLSEALLQSFWRILKSRVCQSDSQAAPAAAWPVSLHSPAACEHVLTKRCLTSTPSPCTLPALPAGAGTPRLPHPDPGSTPWQAAGAGAAVCELPPPLAGPHHPQGHASRRAAGRVPGHGLGNVPVGPHPAGPPQHQRGLGHNWAVFEAPCQASLLLRSCMQLRFGHAAGASTPRSAQQQVALWLSVDDSRWCTQPDHLDIP